MEENNSPSNHDYDCFNYLIGNCDRFESDQWKRHFTPVISIYCSKIDKTRVFTNDFKKTLRIAIIADQWPLKNNNHENLTLGHHYYYVTEGTKRYYFDIDKNEWVDEKPPQNFLEFINKWETLVRSAKTTGQKPNKSVDYRRKYKVHR